MTQTTFFNRFSLAGFAATLIGNGIGRFAYIALMPALIQAGWFSKSDASLLGSATLIGYIFGAPASNWLTRYLAVGNAIRIAMLASGISYLACSIHGMPLAWFYSWRLVAGISGAMLMVLAPPFIVRLHQAKIKARVSGVVFSGIGLGAMLSGTLIPLLLLHTVETAWVGMGMITLLATALTWTVWSEPLTTAQDTGSKTYTDLSSAQKKVLVLTLAAYVFNAIGYLPHTMFWVDFVVRELDKSMSVGGFYWAVFGVGAAIGPIITGQLGDSIGVRKSLLVAFALKCFGVALPLLSTTAPSLLLSSLLVGIFTPGTVTLISIYTLECVGVSLHSRAWGLMTSAFALSQGVASYIMAYYAPIIPSYFPLFVVGSVVLALSVGCIWFTKPPRALTEQAA
ncbi:YbfB/YjiJ family MFS transporter [Stenoxybacter acetivorans]|uniref:YbfB/YjiJ family MFS transporter n=1 Tax=Stenoxybacter acetivorans TaxID=422441 RepID=UPI00068DBF0A|nr:YbfB/YjiJ family MFS transporter [Stenoxybacter acetivorans]